MFSLCKTQTWCSLRLQSPQVTKGSRSSTSFFFSIKSDFLINLEWKFRIIKNQIFIKFLFKINNLHLWLRRIISQRDTVSWNIVKTFWTKRVLVWYQCWSWIPKGKKKRIKFSFGWRLKIILKYFQFKYFKYLLCCYTLAKRNLNDKTATSTKKGEIASQL